MASTNNARLTIETLENMFVYLGCANIPTQAAMDGAIPLESLMDASRGGTVAAFTPAAIETLEVDWSAKCVWFCGDNLGLGTVQNVHWSSMSFALSRVMDEGRKQGKWGRFSVTGDAHGFVKLFYSEIDRFGRFLKFPVRRQNYNGFVVKQLYNPEFVFGFKQSSMICLSSESNSTYEEKGLSFLAPFLCGVAQSLGSYWLVRTKFDAVCPSLTLLTDPTGVKEFWKLRDVPFGRKRRAALLHWVEEHWRQTRNDPDVELFVRKHMRGHTELTHGKFHAEISPSKQDSLDEQKAAEQREMLRKLKADRRRRQRRVCKR